MSLVVGTQGQKAYGLCKTTLYAELMVPFFHLMNLWLCTTLPPRVAIIDYYLSNVVEAGPISRKK